MLCLDSDLMAADTSSGVTEMRSEGGMLLMRSYSWLVRDSKGASNELEEEGVASFLK